VLAVSKGGGPSGSAVGGFVASASFGREPLQGPWKGGRTGRSRTLDLGISSVGLQGNKAAGLVIRRHSVDARWAAPERIGEEGLSPRVFLQ